MRIMIFKKALVILLTLLLLLPACGCNKTGIGSDSTDTQINQESGSMENWNQTTIPEETENPEGVKSPLQRENITLNAYLVPLFSEELRKSQFEYCKAAEIDVLSHIYVAEEWVATDHTADKYISIMKEASQYGLKVLSRDYRIQTALERDDAEIASIAEEYKDVPGFGGFFVVDEPYNPNPYSRVENALRSVCPDAYINVNFLPQSSYPAGVYIKQLTDYASVLKYGGTLSMDAYCFGLDGGVNEAALFGNYNDIRKAGLMSGCDTAVYVQSVGLTNGYRRPSAADLRYNMMAALAYGVKEIKFFTWGTPGQSEGAYSTAIFDREYKPTELYDEVCLINKKIHRIGTYLAKSDALYVYHSKQTTKGVYETVPEELFIQPNGKSDVIISLFKEREGDGEYVMIVNKNIKKNVTASFKLDASVDSLQIVNEETGELQNLPLEDGGFTYTFAASDAILLKLPHSGYITREVKDSINYAVDAKVTATSSAGENGYYLYNIYDGTFDGAGARIVSTGSAEESVTFDFGKVRTVNRVDVYPAGTEELCGKYYPASLRVSVSEDGENWTEVVKEKQTEQTYPLLKVPVYRFDAVSARFVRLTFTEFKKVDGKKICDIGQVGIYDDDGSINDNIDTLYEKSDYLLSTDKTEYTVGEEIFVTGSGNSTQFIGIYPESFTPGRDPTVYYAYFTGSTVGKETIPENTPMKITDFPGNNIGHPQMKAYYPQLPAGKYKVLLTDDEYNIYLQIEFTIVE